MSVEMRLDARKRETKEAREEGWIPAVVYGHGTENRSVSLPSLHFGRVWKSAGENTLVTLSIDGAAPVSVLIADTQLDPLSGRVVHADLFQVRMDEEIETSVPVEFVGESMAVKALGGMLIRSLEALEVKCLPSALPHAITVDLSVLRELDDRIRVADIVLPKGVEALVEGDTVIISVAPPRTDAEMASLDEKVEADVTKVAGVIKETASSEDKKTDKK